MKYHLTQDQLKALAESLDLTLKSTGTQYIHQVMKIIKLFDNPAIKTDEYKEFEIPEEELNFLNGTLDIAIRQIGLSGIYGITSLIELLKNPIKEEEEILEVKDKIE